MLLPRLRTRVVLRFQAPVGASYPFSRCQAPSRLRRPSLNPCTTRIQHQQPIRQPIISPPATSQPPTPPGPPTAPTLSSPPIGPPTPAPRPRSPSAPSRAPHSHLHIHSPGHPRASRRSTRPRYCIRGRGQRERSLGSWSGVLAVGGV
jgi:hypothetical protein